VRRRRRGRRPTRRDETFGEAETFGHQGWQGTDVIAADVTDATDVNVGLRD